MSLPSDQRLRQPIRHQAGRDVRIIVGYFVLTLLLTAILAPPLYWGARTMVDQIGRADATALPVLGYVHHHFEKADFARVFNRALLVAALICLWPAVKMLRIRRGEFGLARNPTPWRHLAVGFVAGAGFLLAMGGFYLGYDFFAWRKSTTWSAVLLDSLTRAVGAGIIEEVLFRGALLGLMLRASSPRLALLVVTTIFAAVHFLQPPADVPSIQSGVEWSTGFWLLGQILRTFTHPNFILAEFATLWLAGYLLGWLRLRTRSLWLPIGLHTGWIFALGLFAGVAKASKAVARHELLPWIGETLKTGLVPLGMVALTGGMLALILRRRQLDPLDPPTFANRDRGG
ncbi:MAG: CPBP family intramembrane glutamic endopeptidase [Verrucomicrobiales bacterium]